jgi:arginase
MRTIDRAGLGDSGTTGEGIDDDRERWVSPYPWVTGKGFPVRIDVVTVPYRYDERADGSGRGPDALIEAGLFEALARAGFEVSGPSASTLSDDERTDGSIAVNIGRLGANTARLVANGRKDAAGVLVLAGDDTAMVGVVSGLQQAHGAGARIGLVWIDAHGDFNTPETSYSGILAGMPVAILAGLAGPLWRGAAGLAAPVPTDRIVISGVRDLDEREATLLQSTDVRVIRSTEATTGNAHRNAIERLVGVCDLICLHVDLDVLDPSLVPSSATPEPGGLGIGQASRLIADVLETGLVGVVSIAGLNPGAGQLGRRSLASSLELLKSALPYWTSAAQKVSANADA